MNAQLPPRFPAASPPGAATDKTRNVIAERLPARPIGTCLAPSFGLDAAYGCVDWFMYQKVEQTQ